MVGSFVHLIKYMQRGNHVPGTIVIAGKTVVNNIIKFCFFLKVTFKILLIIYKPINLMVKGLPKVIRSISQNVLLNLDYCKVSHSSFEPILLYVNSPHQLIR